MIDITTIKNDWGNKITPSQIKYLEKFLITYPEIIEVALTRGGYLCIDYKRRSTLYPFGREIRGRRAGWIASYYGKKYDYEIKELSDGVCHDERLGTYTLR